MDNPLTLQTPPSPTTYDETPYPSSAFPQTHPDRLCALGRLFGLEPAEPTQARVLELGCADGANLLPMAQHAPAASFLGLDASRRQIAAGHAAIAATGLTNVELRHQNILEFPSDSGRFDYIIVHGIFSWVPDEVRDKILAICRDHLTEQGIGYISYNAFPGWGMRMALRDMMLFHTRGIADPGTKVKQARALTAFLAESVPTENNPYGLLLRQELDRMKGYDDNYMRHDILEEVNQPFYFSQFVARADAAGLQYLSETSLDQMLASRFPLKVAETLAKVGQNVVAQEQYMDFVRNRNFRQTLLCRKTLRLERNVAPAAMKRGYFTSLLVKPDRAQFNPAPGAPSEFKLRTGTAMVNTSHGLIKAAFDTLADYSVERISFADLLSIARQKSVAFSGPAGATRPALEEEDLLARDLLRLYSGGVVDLFAAPLRLQRIVPEKPSATPLARYQAVHWRLVTNHAHQPLKFDALGQRVLAACDGTRDENGVLEFVLDAVRQGHIRLAENQQPVTDETRRRELLQPRIRPCLEQLARQSLFASDTVGAPAHVEDTAQRQEVSATGTLSGEPAASQLLR